MEVERGDGERGGGRIHTTPPHPPIKTPSTLKAGIGDNGWLSGH